MIVRCFCKQQWNTDEVRVRRETVANRVSYTVTSETQEADTFVVTVLHKCHRDATPRPIEERVIRGGQDGTLDV